MTAQLQCEIVHFSVVRCEGMADGLKEGKNTVGGGIGEGKVKGIGNRDGESGGETDVTLSNLPKFLV